MVAKAVPEEKRSYPRANLNLSASYKSQHEKEDAERRVYNISTRGLGLFCRRRMEEGEVLEVMVDVSSKERVTVEAEVIWSRPTDELGWDVKYCYACGLKILRVDYDSALRLAELVKETISGDKGSVREDG